MRARVGMLVWVVGAMVCVATACGDAHDHDDLRWTDHTGWTIDRPATAPAAITVY